MTGRVADPSLFLAPIAAHHGWRLDDATLAGRGTLVGHMLECAGQVTGGYFADPGRKDVADLARLGFPLAEVDADGTAIITKVADQVDRSPSATCKEQLLYEIHDPAAYVTPDVVADFSRVRITDLGSDRVRVEGAAGRARPATLRCRVGQFDGWIGEGQISYAGAGAARAAASPARLWPSGCGCSGVTFTELRSDLIGVDALHGPPSGRSGDPYEVRLRVAARTASEADALAGGARGRGALYQRPGWRRRRHHVGPAGARHSLDVRAAGSRTVSRGLRDGRMTASRISRTRAPATRATAATFR